MRQMRLFHAKKKTKSGLTFALLPEHTTHCPLHHTRLIPAQRERHLLVLDDDGRVPYRCCHTQSHAFKYGKPLCSKDELYVCTDDTCSFCVCSHCLQPTYFQDLLSIISAQLYNTKNDPETALTVVVFLLIQIIYLPVIENSFAVVFCHPSLAVCQFSACTHPWSAAYAVGFALSLFLLFAVGLGVPCFWLFVLIRRRKQLAEIRSDSVWGLVSLDGTERS